MEVVSVFSKLLKKIYVALFPTEGEEKTNIGSVWTSCICQNDDTG